MYKLSILTLIFIALFFSTQGQNTIGTLRNDEGAFDGYTLFAPNFSTETYLINNCGQVVHQWSSTYNPGVAVYLLENGNLLRTGGNTEATIKVGAFGGQLELFDWDGNLIWEYTYLSDTKSQHHDVFPMPNGNILILAATIMTNEEAIQAGRNPQMLVGNLYNEQIVEIEPVGTNEANIVWEWNIKDHLVQDIDETKDNFGVIVDHPELLDVNFGVTGSGLANWLHINSINYNADLDQIIMSSKNLNEVYIIDHSTTTAEAATHAGGTYGKGGDILYRWGNPESHNHGTSEDKMLFGQHFAHWIPEGLTDAGKIMIFNNGDSRGYSSLDIINPAMTSPGVYDYNSTDGFSPTAPEWSYVDPNEPTNFFSRILSGGQRLPNGGSLIVEGTTGHFFEIDSDENIVWEYVNPINAAGIATQGETPENNFMFRAHKFAKDYSAFTDKDLTPGDPIELNFDISEVCEDKNPVLSVNSQEPTSSKIVVYPNPNDGVFSVDLGSHYEAVNIKITDVGGRVINASNYSQISRLEVKIPQSALAGVYFLKVSTKKGPQFSSKIFKK